MALWTRLLGGIATPPSPKQDTPRRSDQLLTAFKRAYNHLTESWRRYEISLSKPVSAEPIRVCLERLAAILKEESTALGPHRCLAFALSSQLPSLLFDIALNVNDKKSTRAALSIFSLLVDSEEVLVGDEGFAGSLINLAKTIAGADTTGLDILADLVELLFGVATNIRLQPDILPAWFKPKSVEQLNAAEEDSYFTQGHAHAGVRHQEEFALFYMLMDYVHYEKPIGDFARTGLLYIIESASSSQELEYWLVECDLADLMASGLGALYSQLSRKLTVSFSEEDELPAILALSDYSELQPISDAQSSNSSEFRTHMDTFLSYLMFWQDVLEHCNFPEVKRTLLDHFQVLFLQQLLYPSLVESSDIDGGSSVAVLTYLCRILESLHQPDLTNLVLQYLFGAPEDPLDVSISSQKTPRAMRRRTTLELHVRDSTGEEEPSPTLFSLVDLVVASVSSQNQQTVAATLKLVSVLVQRHHPYAWSKIFRSSHVSSPLTNRTIGAHNKEMEILLSLAIMICDDDGCDDTYDSHLTDSKNILETHVCSALRLSERGGPSRQSSAKEKPSRNGPARAYTHSLRLEEPFLRTVMKLLETFLANGVETNLSLTGAIIALASCPYTRLEGWILVDPSKYDYQGREDSDMRYEGSKLASNGLPIDPADQSETDRLVAMRRALRTPSWAPRGRPLMVRVLQSLVDQIDQYRSDIPAFDELLAERKRNFQLDDKLEEAVTSTTPSTPMIQSENQSASVPPVIGEPFSPIGSISRRFFGSISSNSTSRSGSPRGRQLSTTSTIRPTRDGELRISSPASNVPSRDIGSPSPTRDASISSVPPRSQIAEPDSAPLRRHVTVHMRNQSSSDAAPSQRSCGTALTKLKVETATKQISVSHLLTNAILLQEFIFELAALIQTRASLFEDVRFL
ncbi:MAG: hypothetical protein M1816_002753 [Peltula sp. TS41687]|nr:MAG: hypothetical protein M1816_002753 [Peltula sp. TS41687]